MKVDGLTSASQSGFVPVALDSTKLISADSFLFDALASKDPRARPDFQFVTTAFCNETAPYFAAPKSGREQPHATELLKLWQRTATRDDTVSILLEDDKLFAEMAPIFAEEFRDLGKATDLANWVRYQLSCDDLVAIFWEGGNAKSNLEQALFHIEPLLNKKHPVTNLLNQMDLQFDREFLSRSLNSKAAIAKAYAFLAFKKGRDYVYKLPPGLNYMPHWLRKGAQPELDREESNVTGEFPATFFPWGDLVANLLSIPKYSFHLSPRTVAAFLTELRKITIEAKPYQQAVQTNAEKRVEEFVIDALHNAARWIPPKEQPAVWLQYLNDIGRKFAGEYVQESLAQRGAFGSESAGPFIEAVWYTIGRDVVRSTEYAGRRLYHRLVPRSSALQVYSSKEIRRTARVFVKGVRDASGVANDLTPAPPQKSRGKVGTPRG